MKKLIYSISITMLLLSTNIASAEVDIGDTLALINSSFSASFTTMRFNYLEAVEDTREINPDIPGDIKDSGWAFGATIAFRNVFFEKMYTELSGEYTFGKLKYEGFTKDASFTPLSQKVSSDFFNIDAKLGFILVDTQYFQIIPYGGLGFRYWQRHTMNDYTYYNFKPIVGAKINCAFFDDLVLSPYANIGTTYWAHAKSKEYDDDKNYIGKANLKLGKKLIREFGLEINYRLDHELFLTGTVSHTHFGFGKSDPQDVGTRKGITEPNSTTNELRFSIGMRYGFM